MSLTISPSPFGSLVVSVAETGSTLSVTTVATSPSVLTMALGVPGPQGDAGPAGSNGVGVAAGGTTGQALVKLSNADFSTGWATITSGGGTWGSITGTLSNQTDLYDALNGKLSLSGGTMSGAILFDAVGGQNISKGSFDSGRGGYNGISLNCANLYELNWQSGYLKNIYNGSVAPINVESDLVNSTIPDIDNQGYRSTFNYSGLSVSDYTGSENNQTTIYGYNGISGSVFDNPQGFALNYNGAYGTGNDAIPWGIGIGGVTFPDATVQTTAFPPDGGLVTEYITGTGTLVTFPPVGDRYLTSSTSTLTCDSGNGKTMTVGTGLSYSRQQDITVSYSNAIHMHGTVLTYNSTTGVMTFDSNTHSGSGTYSNWEVNVGGVAGAVLPVDGTAGQVLAKINSTNFNTEWKTLGTMSTEPASAYLSTASAVANYLTISSASSTYQTQSGMSAYLSTSAAASTYQTQAGMSAYLSTSAAASTYQTQSGMSAYLSTAAASANFIGTSAYATNLQAVQNTSTSTVLSPANSRFAGISTNIWSPGVGGLSQASSGTGANANSTITSLNGFLVSPNSTTAGYATRGFNLYYPSNSVTAGYNYGTESGHSVRVYANWGATVTGVKMRAVFGRMSAALPVPATLASRGYGWEWDYSTKVISIIAHNGSSLTTTAQTWTPTSNRTYEIAVYHNGSGTISLYIDGTLIGTGTGAPTTTSTAGQLWWQMEIENQATAGSQQTIDFSNPKIITTNG